jgi:uncharacterized phage-associated protein
MIRFVYDERKSAQAAAHLIRLNDGRMNYMILVKLLYMADRKSLVETGIPITGDRMCAMDNGPILSRTLDLINMGKEKTGGRRFPWYEYITEPDGYDVALAGRPTEIDELSEYEIGILHEMHGTYGRIDKWDLVGILHGKLPEWRDPGGSSFEIDPAEILKAEGKSPDEIEKISADAAEISMIDNLPRIQV